MRLVTSSTLKKAFNIAHIIAHRIVAYQRGIVFDQPTVQKSACINCADNNVMSDTAAPGQWTLIGPGKQKENLVAKPYATANDLAMIRSIALDGGGIALLPSYLSLAPEKSGELRRVLPAWRTPAFSYHALYPSRHGVTLKLRAWLDFFESKLNQVSTES